MNASNSFRLALRGLLINKGRSLLTLLGIVIGIGAVITITALAEGLQAQATNQISSMGTNLIWVFPQISQNDQRTTEGRAGYIQPRQFTAREVRTLEAAFRAPAIIAPSVQNEANVSYGRNNMFTTVQGVDENDARVYNIGILSGRKLSPAEISGARRVAVLGYQTAQDLFGDEDPIGQTIRISGNSFQVVGVFKQRGGGIGENQDKVVQVPMKVAQQVLFGMGDKILVMTIQPENVGDVEVIKEDIKRALNRVRRIEDAGDQDYMIMSQTDAIEQFGQFIKVLTYVLGGVAAVSLLVGGIGIMNIMLVSVTERTREIGLRKAVGARQVDILFQFLIEAIVLCLLGGIVGMLLGYLGAVGLSAIIQNAAPEASWKPVISLTSVVIAIVFSTMIGVVFGVYPAANAARKDPILALRYE